MADIDFNIVYAQHAEEVYRFLLRLCGDATLAEDLLQNTFLKAIEKVDTFDSRCKLTSWLCQIATSASQLKPMKKLYKKLNRRKWISIFLGLILIILISLIGVLSYGQVTNKCTSFSVVADVIRLNTITQAFAKGDTQPLIDNLSFYMEEVYFINGMSEFESFEGYQAYLKAKLDDLYTTHLQGKKLTPKLVEVSQNPYYDNSDMYVDYLDKGDAYYLYTFFDEKGVMVFHMCFRKMSENKFRLFNPTVSGDVFNENFTANLPVDDIILTVGLRYPFNEHFIADMNPDLAEHPGMYISIGVRKYHDNALKERLYQTQMEEQINALCDSGLQFKDALFSIDTFDMDNNYWIYKVWFYIENEATKETSILQCRLAYLDSILYVIPEEIPEFICGADSVTAEQREQIISLFSY